MIGEYNKKSLRQRWFKMYSEIDKLIEREQELLKRINNGEMEFLSEQLNISKRFCELYEINKIPKRF